MKADEFFPFKARLQNLRYLLVAQPPWFRDHDGSVWVDPSWAHDLLRHLDYISHLTVLAPRLIRSDGPPEAWHRLQNLEELRFLAWPDAGSTREGIARLPEMVRAGINAVRQADVVHSGAAGWPIPPGFIINPIAVAIGKPLVIVVESAFWRGDGSSGGVFKRAMSSATERLAKWSVTRARLSVFTHQSYAQTLANGARGKVLVTPASWIDEGDILSSEVAVKIWSTKPDTPRFLLAARLVEEKGIPQALKAMELAESREMPITLDIIGEGPLATQVEALAARLKVAKLRLLAPVPYGVKFFELLREYHAIVVPSVSDEQPRILYDAFAQAVPVLASDTVGHREAVVPYETGLRFAPNDPTAMLESMAGINSEELRTIGLTARDRALSHTHHAMHLIRAETLAAVLG